MLFKGLTIKEHKFHTLPGYNNNCDMEVSYSYRSLRSYQKSGPKADAAPAQRFTYKFAGS